jgi:hypothetical protein
MKTKLTGALLASSAAMLFTAAIPVANAEEAKIHCEGVNSCKGTSACATKTNACKGQNSCKGQGFLEMTQAQCDAAKAKLKQG